MPMRRNKAETAVHGCHYLGDMDVHMPDCGLVFERVTCKCKCKSNLMSNTGSACFYCLKRVTVDCVKCVSVPLKTG